MGEIKSFKELKIWQKGIEIVKDVYMLTKEFPKEEIYGLTSQIKRSSISIPSNIAEGFKRYHSKEYRQFLHIALGSAAELETHLVIAKELKFIKQEESDGILEKIDHVSRMISSLLNKLK
ncbi:MAG TPA: four helix bundle protein [Candidatus Omnitrophica bacterium]|nr:four helix bundle protein [Candidatus Omnitrophota bacterium]